MSILDLMHHAMSGLAGMFPAFADTVVRGSLVLAFALVLTTLMRRTSAAARHAVWVSAILIGLVVPLLGPVAPHWDVRVLPVVVNAATPAPTAAPRVDVITVATAPVAQSVTVGSTGSAVTSAPDVPVLLPRPATSAISSEISAPAPVSGWSSLDWVATIWLVIAFAIFARYCIGTAIVWHAARRSGHVQDADWLALAERTARELDISRPVTLLQSPGQIVPVTWGVLRPVIMLPASASTWQLDRREAVLVHELAHIARFDALTQTIVQFALAVFWFNPLFWFAARQMRNERERACDDLVLAHGTRASFYADDLLAMVRMLTRNTEPAFAALAMARRSEFEGRMLAILDPRTDRRRPGRRGALIAATLSVMIALPLAALRPLPRASSSVAPRAQRATTSGSGSATRETVTAQQAAGAGSDLQLSSVFGAVGNAVKRGMSVGQVGASCSSRSGHHVSINSNDSESTYVISNDSRCLIVRTSGKVTFTDDDARVRSISRGGHVSITEWVGNDKREYEASPSGSGLQETFSINDKRVDAAANASWLRTVILELVRQDASFAPVRAARIRATRGVSGVLSEVHEITGDYAKSAYLDALLGEPGMAPDSVHMILKSGTGELTSDYYKAGFLKHVAQLSHDETTNAAIASAAGTVSSDYYKNELLASVLASSGSNDAIARQAVVAAGGMESDYYRAGILLNVLGRANQTDASLMSIIGSADHLTSDYYRAAVLDSMVKSQSLASKAVYTALLRSADGIPSSYSHAQVLSAILARPDLSSGLALETINAVARLDSDFEKGQLLNIVASKAVMKDPEVKAAFFRAAKGIASATAYRTATSGALP